MLLVINIFFSYFNLDDRLIDDFVLEDKTKVYKWSSRKSDIFFNDEYNDDDPNPSTRTFDKLNILDFQLISKNDPHHPHHPHHPNNYNQHYRRAITSKINLKKRKKTKKQGERIKNNEIKIQVENKKQGVKKKTGKKSKIRGKRKI